MMRAIVTGAIVVVVLGLIGVTVYFSSDTSADTRGTDHPTVGDGPSAGVAVEGNGITVMDDRGRAFHFDAPPKRIAACSAFAVEILMALDTRPAARFEDPDLYPSSAADVPVVGRSHSTGPDVEQLIAANPDVIILHEVYGNFADAVEGAVGVPVMVMNIKTLDQVGEKLDLFGKLTGEAEKAQALIADLDRTRAWLDEHRPEGGQPKALSLFGTDDAWYAHRNNHFMGSLMMAVGAENTAGDDEAHTKYRSLSPIDLEMAIAKDPEVIFLIPYGDAQADQVIERFNSHPATRSLRAVREGRVHLLDDTIYTSQPGPRSGRALRNLYTLLYPDQPKPDW